MKHLKAMTRSAGCIVVFAVLTACAKKEEAPSGAPVAAMSTPESAADTARSAEPAAQAREESITAATAAEQMGSSAATYTDSERKFIRTAKARFGVKDVYLAALGIEDTVASHGGFVVKNDISTERLSMRIHPVGDGKLVELSEYQVNGNLIVRVPSAKTQEFLRAIVSHIVFLDDRRFAARDAQFDLLRKQLEMLRNQETQTELGDAVEDGGKLRQKTDAISSRNAAKAARDEAHLARKEFEDQVAFSTIELRLYQPSKVLQAERVDVDSAYRQLRPGFFNRMGEELRGGWEGLVSFILALVGIWPVLLIAGLIAPMLWRIKRRKPKVAAAAE